MSQPEHEQQPNRWALGQRAQSLRAVGLTLGLSPQAVRRARLHLLVLAPLFAGVILIWDYRHAVFGLMACVAHTGRTVLSSSGHYVYVNCKIPTDTGTTVLQVFVVIALIIVGWALARDFVRGAEPLMFRRMDKATAGTAGFLIRLLTVLAAIVVALRIAGVPIAAIAIGASFSAVVFGLAAQQTLGNLIAGIVLISARPFVVGDRVRLQGGGLAGRIEGMVAALGLLYTTINVGGDYVLVPNSLVLAVSVSPLREPEAVSLRARLRPGSTPAELQKLIEHSLSVPLRRPPSVTLEELDGAEVVVAISATPRVAGDGGRLATELLEAVGNEINAAASPG
ncbi:MAG TPA: mechanosensitive ion channel family protein [Solirubrobacteraceae bacterium]